jgi:hypothetical protein
MADNKHISVPIVEHDGHRWAAISYYGPSHEITAEGQPKIIDQKYGFKDGHRVRLIKLKKQVYWKIPPTALDISEVSPRRVQGG